MNGKPARTGLCLLVAAIALLVVMPAAGVLAAGGKGKRTRSYKRKQARPPLAEPAVTRQGSDRSRLPTELAGGDWIELHGNLLSLQMVVEVLVEGKKHLAVIDTGASSTVMSRPVAARLGLDDARYNTGEVAKVIDAHGDIVKGHRVEVPELTLGRRVFTDISVPVIGNHPDLFLIGADVLQQVDLYLAADEGLVGIFPAGQAPIPAKSREVSINRHRRQIRVDAAAPSTGGELVEVELIIDTGASQSAIPAQKGINGRLPADIGYKQVTVALGGELENRGRFVLDPMHLGPQEVRVPFVLANPSVMERGRGVGLLGNDVLMRFHTVISFGRGHIWLADPPERPAHRSRGPAGRRCATKKGVATPCVEVAIKTRAPDRIGVLESLRDRCLDVSVHPAYAGRTLEMVVTADRPEGGPLFAGGALQIFVTAGKRGFDGCFGLWPELARLGLTDRTPLSLRWVRTEGIDWPCDGMRTQCIRFTGPLADAAD